MPRATLSRVLPGGGDAAYDIPFYQVSTSRGTPIARPFLGLGARQATVLPRSALAATLTNSARPGGPPSEPYDLRACVRGAIHPDRAKMQIKGIGEGRGVGSNYSIGPPLNSLKFHRPE